MKDFLNFNNYYDGKYLDMYKFDNYLPYPLSILGDSLAKDDIDIDTSAYYTPREHSKIDYRVYWYGEVNVWLDYVRLDDEWAHFLFTDPEGNLPITVNKYKFGEKIRSEVLALSNISGFGYFYFDEFYYNSIPCIKEVLRLIKLYNPNAGIVVLSPPAGFTGSGQAAGIKNELTLSAMYDTLKQAGLYTDFVATDVYSIFDNSPIPPNLSKPNPVEFPGTIRYQKAASVEQYNDNLNSNILNQGMRDLYKLNANIIKTNINTVFVATIQAHTVESNFQFSDCGQTPNYELKREPTNEEIGLQAFYAMAYGAKQIHYYTHFSGRVQRNNPDCPDYFYDWGLTTFETAGLQQRRDTNYYGQRKWDYIRRLDSNLLKIGDYMYQQNNLKYDNTIAIEKSESYGFISGLKSYYRDPSTKEFTPINEDPANKTYWEIGFFNNPNNSAEINSKYILVLNKRCVPEIPEGAGDIRRVKILINKSNLVNFNNWLLINPITNESITFDKNNAENGIYLPDNFLPGEGKLFKLAPVMQEGGSFVCDEEVENISFICKGIVNTNGFNLTLNNVTASFKSNCGINVNGGNLVLDCGTYQGNDIYAAAGSIAIMKEAISYSGRNILTSAGNNSSNIELVNSDMMLDSGYNSFELSSGSQNYHFNGYIPLINGDAPDSTIYQRMNCFKQNGSLTAPLNNLKRGSETGQIVNIEFNPQYNCTTPVGSDMIVDFIVPLEYNLIDTVYKSGENSIYSELETKKINVHRNFRMRNYPAVKSLCIELLNNYSDSIFIPDFISKLYYSTLKTDTSASSVQELKTYLEQKILTNPGNTTLVKSSFYYIQKCKVYLKQYPSALIGFEEIINQNPYSYEGLLASWDYSATVLQMDTSLISGGNYIKYFLLIENASLKDSIRFNKMLKTDNYDKKVFTKEDRKKLFHSAREVFSYEKAEQEKKVKSLEETSRTGSRSAQKELKQLKAIKEVVKTVKPKSISEYVNNVNGNIAKVFESYVNENYQTVTNIPSAFSLYQNYPNPFNPSTKICYDLPKDVRVTIIIYDILGREITKLINNEFRQAGRYTTEFNASNLSSGIYFYQLRAGEYIQAKKMLMLK